MVLSREIGTKKRKVSLELFPRLTNFFRLFFVIGQFLGGE